MQDNYIIRQKLAKIEKLIVSVLQFKAKDIKQTKEFYLDISEQIIEISLQVPVIAHKFYSSYLECVHLLKEFKELNLASESTLTVELYIEFNKILKVLLRLNGELDTHLIKLNTTKEDALENTMFRLDNIDCMYDTPLTLAKQIFKATTLEESKTLSERLIKKLTLSDEDYIDYVVDLNNELKTN